MLSLVLVAGLAAGIEFTQVARAVPFPVHIDECSAARNGPDLVYHFDVSNLTDKRVRRVEVAFVFENPGDKSYRGLQHFSIAESLEAGQSLRYSANTQELRRVDVSHGARFAACSVVGVLFADGSHLEAAPDPPSFTKAEPPATPLRTP
jgi:hypothetical protein